MRSLHAPLSGPAARLGRLVLVLALLLLGLPAPSARAASLPTGFSETQITNGLSSPTAMALAPDGRLFVAEQGGALRVIKNGALLSTPFVSLTVNDDGERGLLGVAFDPSFASNGYVYVYYTATTPAIHNRVSRFTASGDTAVPGSEVVLMDLENLSATNHNGGALHFGSDGKLYIAVGDNAVASNSQTTANRLGKVLRVNADGSIPSGNPFGNTIWHLGLRNPFTFAVQPGTGRLFINDVGQGSWEEINDGGTTGTGGGRNFGWPTCEGNCGSPQPTLTNPLYAYANDSSTCAITGGAFYNPTTATFPADYLGDYFFGDLCAGWLKRYDLGSGTVTNFASGISSPVDLAVAPDGSLYYLARGANALYRVQYTGSGAPTISSHPTSQTVAAGQAVTFTVGASGSPPLSYQWQRNGANIAGATSASYTFTAALGDNGAQYRCVVTNGLGNATSNPATLTVLPGTAPTGTITAPAVGARYRGGQTITFAGTGSDPQDGTLPASRFSWRIDLHHDTHTHPALPPTSGITSGTFTIPNQGETSANVWYRIHLTVTDATGLSHASFRDILPTTATITLATSPAGLQLTLDGQPTTAPTAVLGVAGIQRAIGVATTQTVAGVTYAFVGWSDGGAATHTIDTPVSDTTYTATFRVSATPTAPSGTWYFAEGYTGSGFDEYLTILNPNATSANVAITYYLSDGTTVDKALTVPATTRSTVAVHETTFGVGRDQAVAARVTTTHTGGIVVERPIYFRYTLGDGGVVTGGQTVIGATAPRASWYFAEGYTGAGFDEYLTILNPNTTGAAVTITYYLDGGGPVTRTLTVGARTRATVRVHDATEGVGRDQAVAARVTTTHTGGIVVERPIYFRYGLSGGGTVDGGHIALGAAAPRTTWYFAEGYTGSGFDEYLTILNPNATSASVTITYYLASGAPVSKTLTVPAARRATVAVHDTALGVGRNQAVAARVTTTNGGGVVVERPLYFRYNLSAGAGGGVVDGGHDALGAPTPRVVWYLAEGYTGAGFDAYLTILNPNASAAGLLITYYLANGTTVDRAVTAPANARATVAIHDPSGGVGRGQAVAARVVTTNSGGVVVERPVYFTYNGLTGGHNALGYAP